MGKSLAVIGGGNAGFAMAGDLTLSGFDVRLYELTRFENNILPVQEKGGIEVTGALKTGFAKLPVVTTKIGEAIEGCSSIMVVTQALAHEEVANLLAPVVRPGQCIYLLPGTGVSNSLRGAKYSTVVPT